MNLLIVEDEALVALLAQDIAEDAGYTVCGIAADQSQALALAATHAPDLALVDLKLAGGSDGREVARLLSEQHGCAIVFVTGTPHLLGRPAAWPVVRKPYRPGDLVAAIETVRPSTLGRL
jgi:DNA-binding response OmpR family regulator